MRPRRGYSMPARFRLIRNAVCRKYSQNVSRCKYSAGPVLCPDVATVFAVVAAHTFPSCNGQYPNGGRTGDKDIGTSEGVDFSENVKSS